MRNRVSAHAPLAAAALLAALSLAAQVPRKETFALAGLIEAVSQASVRLGSLGVKLTIATFMRSVQAYKTFKADLETLLKTGKVTPEEALEGLKTSGLSPTQKVTAMRELKLIAASDSAAAVARRATEAAEQAARAAVNTTRRTAPEFAAVDAFLAKHAGSAPDLVGALRSELKPQLVNSFKKGGVTTDAAALKVLQKEGLHPGNVTALRDATKANKAELDALFAELKLSPNGAPLTFAQKRAWLWKWATVAAGVAAFGAELALFLQQAKGNGGGDAPAEDSGGGDENSGGSGTTVALILSILICVFAVSASVSCAMVMMSSSSGSE